MVCMNAGACTLRFSILEFKEAEEDERKGQKGPIGATVMLIRVGILNATHGVTKDIKRGRFIWPINIKDQIFSSSSFILYSFD